MIWCVSTYARTHPHHRPAVISSLAIPPVYSVIEFPLWATFTRLYRYLSCCLHWCSLLLFLSNRSVALEHLPLSCRLVFPAFFSLSVDLYGELLRTRTLNQRCNVVYCIKWMGGFPSQLYKHWFHREIQCGPLHSPLHLETMITKQYTGIL